MKRVLALCILPLLSLLSVHSFASTDTASLGSYGSLSFTETDTTGSCPNGVYSEYSYSGFVYISPSGTHTSLSGADSYYVAGNCAGYVPNGPVPSPTLTLTGTGYTITFYPGQGGGGATYNPTGGGGPLPTPPSTATTFSNLQESAGTGAWTLCNYNVVYSDGSHCAAGGTGTSGSATLTYGQTPKVSSGGSLKFTNTGANFNTLYYRHLGNSWPQNDGTGNNSLPNIGNMLLDLYFYAEPTSLNAYEFDPDLGTGTAAGSYAYKASLQCDHAGGDVWRLFKTTGGWVKTTYPCNFGTSAGVNKWHHIQLYVTFNQGGKSYTYQTLVVDGTTVFSPSSPAPGQPYFACGPSTSTAKCGAQLGDNVNIEMQIDNGATAGTNIGFYDNYTLTIW